MTGPAPFTGRKTALWAARLLGSGLACLAVGAVPGKAGESDWQHKPYQYVVINQDLRSALIEFGRNLGLPVKLGDDVKGRLRAMPAQGDAKGFLERLAAAHGLVWYFDGTTLHIDAQSTLQTELVALDGATLVQLDQMLRGLGIADSRFPLRSAGARGVVALSGPPAYRKLVRDALGQLKGGRDGAVASRATGAPADAAVKVRVFRGGPPAGS